MLKNTHNTPAHAAPKPQPNPQPQTEFGPNMGAEPFSDTLARLEAALEMPVIPGEMTTWAKEVCAKAAATSAQLQVDGASRYAEAFATIETEDTDLFRKVEQMRAEDQAIGEAFAEFLASSQNLIHRTKRLAPDEAASDADVQKVREVGIALVIRIRMLVSAIKAWSSEALLRDRGVKD